MRTASASRATGGTTSASRCAHSWMRPQLPPYCTTALLHRCLCARHAACRDTKIDSDRVLRVRIVQVLNVLFTYVRICALHLTLTLTLALTLGAQRTLHLRRARDDAWSKCSLASAPARLLRLPRGSRAAVGPTPTPTPTPTSAATAAALLHLNLTLAALGSSALPGRGRSTGRLATALGARSSRLQSRRFRRL